MFESNENEAVEVEEEQIEEEGEESPDIDTMSVTEVRKAVRASKAVYVFTRFSEFYAGFVQAKKGAVLEFLRDLDRKDEVEAFVDENGVWLG